MSHRSIPTDREICEARASLEAENDFADDDFTHFRDVEFIVADERSVYDAAYHTAFRRCQAAEAYPLNDEEEDLD